MKLFGLGACVICGCASLATVPLQAAALYSETFDTDPTLSATQAPGVYYTDRYAPAVFESASFDGDNRLHVMIDGDEGEAGRASTSYSSSFYNTQGRKFDTPGATGFSIDLYVGDGWTSSNARNAGIWGTAVTSTGDVSAYPIVAFRDPTDAQAGFFYYESSQPAPGYLPVGGILGDADEEKWYTISVNYNGSSFEVSIVDEFGADYGSITDATGDGTSTISNVIIQAYNFGEDYDVYWDNLTVIPEPASFLGLCTLLVATRRRRSA